MDTKRLVVAVVCLVALVGGYYLIKFVLMDQLLFAQKQLGDPSELATAPAPAAAPVKPKPAAPAPAAREFDVWFRVSGASPEARVTYTDAAGEKGGVVVKLPWQVAATAREGDRLALVVDNQTAETAVAEIFVTERGPAAAADGPPAGAVPWQRGSAGSYGVARLEGTVGK